MPLTDLQRTTVQSLEWLYDPSIASRRTGRTLAQIIALIRLAARTPGVEVACIDHHPGDGIQRIQERLRDSLEAMVHADPRLQAHYQRYSGRRDSMFRFSFRENMRPIEDWWPPEEVLGLLVPLPPSLGETELLNRMDEVLELIEGAGVSVDQEVVLSLLTREKTVKAEARPTLFQHLLND